MSDLQSGKLAKEWVEIKELVLSLTLEDFYRVQGRARKEGKSVHSVLAGMIRDGLKEEVYVVVSFDQRDQRVTMWQANTEEGKAVEAEGRIRREEIGNMERVWVEKVELFRGGKKDE